MISLMSNINSTFTDRVSYQKLNREKRKSLYQKTINDESDSDSNSVISKSDENFKAVSDDESTKSVLNNQPDHCDENHYHPDKYNNIYNDDDVYSSKYFDDTPALYNKSTITTGEAISCLMEFCVQSKLDKQQVIKMMPTVKFLLPSSNKLLTSFRRILDLYGRIPSYSVNFYCYGCWKLTRKSGTQHYCNNTICDFFNSSLSKRQMTEIAITNIRDKLQSIIRRNLIVLNNSEDYLLPFYIPSSERYQIINKGKVHPITLAVHTDGTPLVRSTKASIWPCFSSIIELLLPVREYKENVLILGL